MTKKAIANHFKNKFKLEKPIGRATIGVILKRAAEYKGLETSFIFLGNELAALNIPIYDEIYIQKAKEICGQIGISVFEFNYSNAW